MLTALISLAVKVWLKENADIVESKKEDIKAELCVLETKKDDPYVVLKHRLRCIHRVTERRPALKKETVQYLVDLINLDPGFSKEIREFTEGEEKASKNILQVVNDVFTESLAKIVPIKQKRPKVPPLPLMEDIEFATLLDSLAQDEPLFVNATERIKKSMLTCLEIKIKKLLKLSHDIESTMQRKMDAEIDHYFKSREKEEIDTAWKSLKARIQETLASGQRENGYDQFTT